MGVVAACGDGETGGQVASRCHWTPPVIVDGRIDRPGDIDFFVFSAKKDEAEIVLTVAKDAKVGLRQDMIISGLMRANNQSIVRYARAIPVMVVAK